MKIVERDGLTFYELEPRCRTLEFGYYNDHTHYLSLPYLQFLIIPLEISSAANVHICCSQESIETANKAYFVPLPKIFPNFRVCMTDGYYSKIQDIVVGSLTSAWSFNTYWNGQHIACSLFSMNYLQYDHAYRLWEAESLKDSEFWKKLKLTRGVDVQDLKSIVLQKDDYTIHKHGLTYLSQELYQELCLRNDPKFVR